MTRTRPGRSDPAPPVVDGPAVPAGRAADGDERHTSRSYGSAALRAGADAEVTCHCYPSAGPILALTGGRMNVSVSIDAVGTEMPAWAVAFARDLAEEAARFAAECERLHAQATPPRGEHGQAAASITAGEPC